MQTSFCLLLLTFATVMSKDEPVAGLFPPGTDYHVSVFFENTVQFCILYVLKSFFPQNHEKPTGSPLKVYGQLNLRNIQGVDDAKMVISLEISLRCKDHKSRISSWQTFSFRLYWMDERLSHSPKELAKHPDPLPKDPSCQAGFGHVNKTYVLLKSEADIRRVWKPDVFVDQAVTIRYNWPMISLFSISCCSRTPKFDEAPQSIKVYENHVVRFSKRINFDIGCQMNFTKYPVDMQICEIKFESFSYSTSVIFKVFSRHSYVFDL